MKKKPRLLVLSAVYPFPRDAGQQQRIFYTLHALRDNFHLTFLTVSDAPRVEGVKSELLKICDEAIVLPSLYTKNIFTHLIYKLAGTIYAIWNGLKFSNYLVGQLEFSQKRLKSVMGDSHFDMVLFEYWHAFKSVDLFRSQGTLAVLDMHDILWQSYARQLDDRKILPGWQKRRLVERYKRREEAALQRFDALVAINQAEYEYVRQRLGEAKRIYNVPMGVDLTFWPFIWQPASPPRIAYYGSLGSRHNQQDALICYKEIMPFIWKQYPEIEFWIVGSNPPKFIQELGKDRRVHVTGYLERPQDVLKTISLVLCPWSGTYGFRSRLVEVMALGVPVIASKDAAHGMGFDVERGIVFGNNATEMAVLAIKWLKDNTELSSQSSLARKQVEENFSYQVTYASFAADLAKVIA